MEVTPLLAIHRRGCGVRIQVVDDGLLVSRRSADAPLLVPEPVEAADAELSFINTHAGLYRTLVIQSGQSRVHTSIYECHVLRSCLSAHDTQESDADA